mmetsp:Transcript_8881/g.20051  ORF Transcript_8881/g.20051 Transcript_8881/m.20051 type:complete len:681 (-) Transcript_8881:30-2072(-)
MKDDKNRGQRWKDKKKKMKRNSPESTNKCSRDEKPKKRRVEDCESEVRAVVETDRMRDLSSDCLENVKDASITVDLGLARKVFWKMAKKDKKVSKQSIRELTPLKPTPVQLKSWPILLPAKDCDANTAASPLHRNSNMICIAPTGSGKTLAYGIPIVQHCKLFLNGSKASKDNGDGESPVFGLVLVPTRELALQVSKEMKKVAKVAMKKDRAPKIEIVPIHGGVDKDEQMERIYGDAADVSPGPRRVIIAATTGRLIDLINTEYKDKKTGQLLTSVRFLVIDEADRMAISGEICSQVDEIISAIPGCQDTSPPSGFTTSICLFSATLPDRVLTKFDEWVGKSRAFIRVDMLSVGINESKIRQSPPLEASDDVACDNKSAGEGQSEVFQADALNNEEVDMSKKRQRLGPLDLSAIPSNITQVVHVCSTHKKPKKLFGMLSKIRKGENQEGGRRATNKSLCIIFFGKIKTLKYVLGLLRKEGHKCAELHSNMDQKAREKAVFDFRSGKTPTMLATDIAARGLDINNVRSVIDYDFPGQLEQYVHRCGRAGRDGQQATVYSYFPREMKAMAGDLIALLKSTGAWVDPNLQELVGGETQEGKKRRKRRKKADATMSKMVNLAPEPAASASKNKSSMATSGGDEERLSDDDDGQFSELSANRIVFKRAAHVPISDPEDGSSDGED